MALSITLKIGTSSIATLRITLKRGTFSTLILSITFKKGDKQHSDTQHNIKNGTLSITLKMGHSA
jgi:hypothetical protein